MRKGTVIGIILAAAALAGLGALSLYLAVQYRETLKLSEKSTSESEAEAVISSLHEPLAQDGSEETQAETETETDSPEDMFLIWAGDSRTLGMRDAVGNDDLYIGASGEGYDWLSETGLPQVKAAIESYPDAPVVFNFGVNDYDNMERYLALYESLLEEYPETHFYFLAVNPIDPEVCQNITNEEIQDFNSHLKDSFPDAFLDSYTYLMANEAVTIDGIHYSKEDYRQIYRYAVSQIARLES